MGSANASSGPMHSLRRGALAPHLFLLLKRSEFASERIQYTNAYNDSQKMRHARAEQLYALKINPCTAIAIAIEDIAVAIAIA